MVNGAWSRSGGALRQGIFRVAHPTGLKPIGNCETGCKNKDGGTTYDWLTPGADGWTYHSTTTYTQKVTYPTSGGGTGVGTMTVTVHNNGGHVSAKVIYKKGPAPKPKKDDGVCNSCWAMGTNPGYDYNAHDLPDTGKLSTLQKVLLGVVTVVGLAVAVAPVAAESAAGCLATAPVCIAEIAEAATGGASGGSAVVGSGAAAASAKLSSTASRGAEAVALGLRREEYVAQLIGGVVSKGPNGQDIKIVMPNVGSSGLDAIGPNGEYVFVGGGAKAANPAKFGKALKINKYAADEAGVRGMYYLDASNTPESAINQARKVFGAENVHTFNMPEG
ncbi:hypothetical protein OKJ48_22625 [Streptomyces kunmingensis]|uniref:Uncharacterized protein n=1 Tax=Streptomyces kunmingensis TaxID=68225 RepID=A0ABU6CGK2_9ACTN|nr:hypothetical protein [Streptomyces kunmingensis]MEB3963020.1 hypothetical protein [Streptomyces kunmingensis]